MNLPSDPEPAEPVAPSQPVEMPAAAGKPPTGDFLVVGLGASAGGLEAISEILKRIPLGANLAIVIVQHLAPHHESILVELLDRVATLPVQWVAHGHSIEPGQVYVSPARGRLSVHEGVLLLREHPATSSGGDIDFFLQSLAESCKHRAVGVILSGNASDGTAGCKAIKEAGGIVFAQDPATAGFPSMPRSVIENESADRVLAPAGIAEELLKLTKTAPALWRRIAPLDDAPPAGGEAEQLAAIFRLLLIRTGVDFSEYKQSTLKRRILRQMMLGKVAELPDYVKLLQKQRDEVDRLYESLLINVTEFFRDPEYFDFLQEHVLPDLIEKHPANMPIRVWIPGVATGEEAYSFGIMMRECMEQKGRILPVQIFGTDVSEHAISHARSGVFSSGDVVNVSPERLKRFFFQTDHSYVVQKSIRDMCVFARQNVMKDSPFSRIDLISCRNLLIYLSPKLQRNLMPIFHYALNPGGYLVLGSSESVGAHADLYRLVDRRFRIYSRKSMAGRPNFDFSVEQTVRGEPARPKPNPAISDDIKEPFDVIREADRIVLHRHAPVGVLVNEDLEILQFRGDVSPYLAPVPGRASLNLLKMAREGLGVELQAITQEARETNVRVQRAGVTVIQGDSTRTINIDVTPIDTAHTKERFYLVLFSPSESAPDQNDAAAKPKLKKVVQSAQVEKLRQELQATRHYLQATIEKHEVTNQELRAANEEIQSSNEELQSTNEELETAKEELQSTNEELTTVNEELHARHLELIQVNNDLTNLINSVHLPIIILGADMRIRRFTPMAEKVLNVIPSDIGRPLTDLNTKLKIDNRPQLMTEVLESLTIKELEVQDRKGRWYSMRLRPYKTADQKIEGIVITLVDIDEMKRTIAEVEQARDYAQAVIQSVPAPLAALDDELRVTITNDPFARLFRTTREAAQGRSFFDLAHENDAMKDLRAALEGILPTGDGLTNRLVTFDLPGGMATRVSLSVRRIASASRSYPVLLLSLRPVE